MENLSSADRADRAKGNSRLSGIDSGQDGAYWQKSSYSTFSSNCVEISTTGNHIGANGRVLVRDSKNPSPVLQFSIDAWVAFTDYLKQ
jgi:Domain of unknown function (DUF397)